MTRLTIPSNLHNQGNGWRSSRGPLADDDANNPHMSVSMSYNQPPQEIDEEYVFAEPKSRNISSSMFSCFSWVVNFNNRRKMRETRKTKLLCSKMCSRIDAKIEDANDRVGVMQGLIRDKVRNKDKPGAKQALIGKKRLERQVATYEAYKRDLDMLADSLEQSEDQKAFIKEMKSANKVLKKQQMGKAIDSVEDLLDGLDDHRDDMEEFHKTLVSRSAGGDGEIEDELAELFCEAPTKVHIDLPSVPTHRAAMQTRTEKKMKTSVAI